jgi:glycosyltransferase involved in cell wall biosynthesis
MHPPETAPIRVLHVIGRADCGGTESWLTSVLQHSDRRRVAMDFLVHTRQSGHYDEAIQGRGASVLRCFGARTPWRYARNFRRLLDQHGPYDVVHSHVSHFSGFVLRLAHQSGVSVRVAHSHHAPPPGDQLQPHLTRRVYLTTTRRWIERHATHRLAASHAAAPSLAHPDRAGAPWDIMHCGVDLSAFQCGDDQLAVRRELGIDKSSFVVGHAGRFVEAKNHRHLLRTMAALVEQDRAACLLLIGDGELRDAMRRYAAELNIAGNVRFVGFRSDTPRLLSCAVDVFAFPSLREGLGLALVEAQAAGLPCIASNTVPEEATVVPQLVQHLPLSAGPRAWAKAIRALVGQPPQISRPAAWQQVAASDFNILVSVERLERLYRDALQRPFPADTARRDAELAEK